MNYSPLLISEHPLMVLPSLATAVGLNQAIVLQQVHYWLDLNRKAKKDSHFRDEHWWTYNTFESWQESNFPFWSVRTLKRVFKSLEDDRLLIARKFNSSDWNHTKWYTIDYEVLNTLSLPIVPICHDQSGQVGTMQGDNVAPSSISTETNNRDYLAETTTTERPKKKKSSSRSGAKEKASLLEGETLDRESAALVNEMLSAYPMLVEEFGIALTSKMVTACHGRSHLDLQAAVLALYQQAETGRLRDPQIYLEDAIAKGWLPSKYWVENGAALTGWTIPQRVLDYIESRRPAEEIALLGVPA